MSTNILGSANFGEISFGNGSSHSDPSAKFPLLNFNKPLWVSDFNIEAPRMKIDLSVKDIVERISKKLMDKPFKYKSRQRKDWRLKNIMEGESKEGTNAKGKLISDGYSATISAVSEKINKSSIDHTTKYLLSNEPLYVYALSFAIYYEKVKDAEGINDRVISLAEREIKGFFNVLLAKATIDKRHLDVTLDQKKNIYKEAAITNISYLKGMPARAISKIIAKYVEHGNIHRLVDKFFESGEIDPSKGTPQIRQLMVKYLRDIGLTVPDGEVYQEAEEIDFSDMDSMEEEISEQIEISEGDDHGKGNYQSQS